ncbi:MAG: DUF2309 domain-containing protein [Pirellulales bacterium]
MCVSSEPIEFEGNRRLDDGAKQYVPESTEAQCQTLSPEERKHLRDEVVVACQPVAQNWPMKTFAYRNPLRGLEYLPFDKAIREAKHLLGGNGYISNEECRHMYRQGHITDDTVNRALQHVEPDIAAQTITIGNRPIASSDVLRLHLLFGFDALDPALLTWQLSAGGSTTRFRHDLPADSRKPQDSDASYLVKLWDSTLSALNLTDLSHDSHEQDTEESAIPELDLPYGRTVSDWLGLLAGASLVNQINDQMIKWTAAFLDEGMAGWEMPERHDGFYQAWRELATRDLSGRFLGIKKFTGKIRDLPVSPEDAIALSLKRLGIPKQRWTNYQSRQLAQLPGWAGFIRWLGENPDYPAQKKHPIDPVQYLAVRLFYEVELVQAFCRSEWGIDGTLCALISYWENHLDEYQQLVGRNSHSVDRHTQAVSNDGWRLFHLAQFLELTPRDVEELPSSDIQILLGWLDIFPAGEHGPVWLDAHESSYREQLIQRLSAQRGKTSKTKARPRAQIVFCIDVRSEPFRRHVEAQGPYETYGFAGFFGLPISHQPFDSSGHAALCPVILTPKFAVHEIPRSGEQEPLQTYASGSRWNQLGHHLFHDLKRNPIGSFMLIDALGLFFSLRLIGKTFCQRPYESIKAWTRGWFTRSVATQIPVDLIQDDQCAATAALPHGFTPIEHATFVENGLRAMGLTKDFGRFVVVCGHGSTSENNPYFAAYNCGACGGGHGDANARVFATMGNKPQVRRTLKENGLNIPDDTWFLAGKHNTVTDQVTFYDLQDVPASHTEDLRLLIRDLAQAGAHQALDRCHRVPQAPRNISPEKARDHMLARSMDWANVRPEWGLSSNAAFILGRRALTSGLDLGGRVFLQSYDPDADTQGTILEALMTAPLVVAQWISMEYYFSAVDPWCYGSGSKVTHNVVSGVGVMHGSHSDLQTGLPLQSVNNGNRHYHEPMRLLAIIEAPTSRISSAIQKHTLLQHLLHNQWINLIAVDPTTFEFHRYNPDSTWELC